MQYIPDFKSPLRVNDQVRTFSHHLQENEDAVERVKMKETYFLSTTDDITTIVQTKWK